MSDAVAIASKVPSKLPVPPFAQWAKEWVERNVGESETTAEAKARARAVWNAKPPPAERVALEEAFLLARVAYYTFYNDQVENQLNAAKFTAKLERLRRARDEPPSKKRGRAGRQADGSRSAKWAKLSIGTKTFYKHVDSGEVAAKPPFRDEEAARASCAPRRFTLKTAFAHDHKTVYGNTRTPAYKEALKEKMSSADGRRELEERAAELNAALDGGGAPVPAAAAAAEKPASVEEEDEDDGGDKLGGDAEDDEEFA